MRRFARTGVDDVRFARFEGTRPEPVPDDQRPKTLPPVPHGP